MTTRSIIGTDLNQVPTNGMLGGLAYQSPDHASITNLDLKNISAINAETADTAVDIFVYDTSKDSDGGAWRKRTQHTSWYNETLNTATRGSRREFPAVAVIVITNNDAGLTIYDGDDPDLPMWMVFKESSGQSIWTGTNRSSVAALNGIIVVGQLTTIPLPIIGFVADEMYNRRTDTTKYNISNIANRHIFSPSITGYFDQGLVNATANDVAMTVLPRAPIDPDTGLQIPTIAVATDGGVSVIKDDGTVVDWSTLNNEAIKITSDKIYTSYGTNGRIYVDPIPTSDLANYGGGQSYGVERHYRNTLTSSLAADDDLYYLGYFSDTGSVISASSFLVRDTDEISVGTGGGLTNISENSSSPANGLVAYTTASYNTGWMHGDIKGAFLADTDDTDLSGSELVTNGDFGTALGSEWVSGNATITIQNGEAKVTSNSGGYSSAYQAITTVIGETYTVSANVNNVSGLNGSSIYIQNGTTLGPAIAITNSIAVGNSGILRKTFTATATTTYIHLTTQSYLANEYSLFDNVSVRLADPDRSVNNNGLAVYGTVAKSAVATGAELVGYSGWSNNTNYLYRPHSTDIEIGTNNACHMGWFNTSDSSATERMVVSFEGLGTYGTAFNVRLESDHKLSGWVTNNNFSSSINVKTSQTLNDGVWHHFAWVKNNGTYSLYVDGIFIASGTYSNNLSYTNNNEAITIGVRNRQKENPFTGGKIALVRFSFSAPSAEQIKKIYDDEKVLFQENTACTLYGSSDAVTALAYDDSTSLLHVGTSSGRSDFTGLKRINHTTTAVSTAISAQDGLIAQQ